MTDGPERESTRLGVPPAPAPQGLDALIGAVIAGRYRVDAPLGEGGMGAVFDGHHLGLDRAIAIKVLRPEFVSDPQVSSRFEREAQAVSRLDHPSIVQVFDVGSATVSPVPDPISYIVMERLRGGELSDALGQPLGEAAALKNLAQILNGLAHAHGRGVIHRDLKPENIFVTQDASGEDRLKLVDFGIAKMLEPQDGAVLTQLGMVFGTPGYMSPEQCIGGEIDGRSDLYSAGIVLYEMLAGHCPFAAPDMMDVLRMHISTPLPAILGIGEGTAAILARLTHKKPGDRYATAAEAHAAVKARIAALPPATIGAALPAAMPTKGPAATQVVPTPAATSQARSTASRRVLGVAAAATAVLLLGWLLWPETSVDPTPLAVAHLPDAAARLEDEEARMEALVENGDREAALEALGAMVEQHPTLARLHWRLAELTGDPKRPSEARAQSIEHALRLDPDRLNDASSRAFVVAEAKRRLVPDPLLDAILDHGESWTPQWTHALLQRERYALGYEQRHRLLDAWAQHDAITDKLRRQHRCLDLWQAPSTTSPCEAAESALAAMEQHPSADYRRTLGAAPLPKGTSGDSSCEGLAKRRDALRKQLVDADGDPKYVPADYASRAKPRVAPRRKNHGRPLKRAVKKLLDP